MNEGHIYLNLSDIVILLQAMFGYKIEMRVLQMALVTGEQTAAILPTPTATTSHMSTAITSPYLPY